MRTEDLIRQLASDARPVRRTPPLVVRIVVWAALAGASLGVVLMYLGIRRELGDAGSRMDFVVESALLLLIALAAAAGALIVSVPGAERSPLVRWLPVAALAMYVLWVAGELVAAAALGTPTGRVGMGWSCVSKTAGIAAVPAVALLLMVRRAAPLRAAWAGLLAILATVAVGALGANAVCPNDRPVHLLVWHVAPLMFFAAAGAALGRWLLGWRRGRPPGDRDRAPVG